MGLQRLDVKGTLGPKLLNSIATYSQDLQLLSLDCSQPWLVKYELDLFEVPTYFSPKILIL